MSVRAAPSARRILHPPRGHLGPLTLAHWAHVIENALRPV
jgi:hypothetical protein